MSSSHSTHHCWETAPGQTRLWNDGSPDKAWHKCYFSCGHERRRQLTLPWSTWTMGTPDLLQSDLKCVEYGTVHTYSCNHKYILYLICVSLHTSSSCTYLRADICTCTIYVHVLSVYAHIIHVHTPLTYTLVTHSLSHTQYNHAEHLRTLEPHRRPVTVLVMRPYKLCWVTATQTQTHVVLLTTIICNSCRHNILGYLPFHLLWSKNQ